MRVLSYRRQPAELRRACRRGSLQALKPSRSLLGSQICSTANCRNRNGSQSSIGCKPQHSTEIRITALSLLWLPPGSSVAPRNPVGEPDMQWTFESLAVTHP